MQTRELVEALAEPIGNAGAAFYFSPATVARGKEAGIDGFRLYFLGRGGVMGDVPAAVIQSAFGYFEPQMVSKVWNSAKERMSPSDGAALYAECLADLGRQVLGEVDGLADYCAAAEKVIAAVDPAAYPLFAGMSTLPVPTDLPGQAMHLTAVLRELRGSAHLAAVRAAGLRSDVAHAIKRPDDLQMFGYAEAPEITDADREAWDRAEDMTNLMLTGPYGTLTEAEGQALLVGARAIEAACKS